MSDVDIYVLRNGEQHKLAPTRIHADLTERGVNQVACAATKYLRDVENIALLYSSPLLSAVRTVTTAFQYAGYQSDIDTIEQHITINSAFGHLGLPTYECESASLSVAAYQAASVKVTIADLMQWKPVFMSAAKARFQEGIRMVAAQLHAGHYNGAALIGSHSPLAELLCPQDTKVLGPAGIVRYMFSVVDVHSVTLRRATIVFPGY